MSNSSFDNFSAAKVDIFFQTAKFFSRFFQIGINFLFFVAILL